MRKSVHNEIPGPLLNANFVLQATNAQGLGTRLLSLHISKLKLSMEFNGAYEVGSELLWTECFNLEDLEGLHQLYTPTTVWKP